MRLDDWLLVGASDEPVPMSASESACGQGHKNVDALRGQKRRSDLLALKGSPEPPEGGAGNRI